MKNILITGGPVYAYLDAIKIITNRFRGGLMADMAGQFVKMAENLHAEVKYERGDKKADVHVIYLCSKNSQQPWWGDFLGGEDSPHIVCIHHDGIEDYMHQVLTIAPTMDAVVLGAAVANLIPKNKIDGKFPSHNYKEGDIIPIEFTIAPRIIDRVKEVAPKTQLFGFKLLSGVELDELVDAAYGVLLESKATAVFANDAMDLIQKYIVCKDRSVHPVLNKDLPQWILDRLSDRYYQTAHTRAVLSPNDSGLVFRLIENYKDEFARTHGMIFGAVAVRHPSGNGFLTTGRGKKELESCVYVKYVDHASRTLITHGPTKATLNAPLLDTIFRNYPDVETILHFHHPTPNIPDLPWFPPGTWEDSQREGATFNIKRHGCIISLNGKGQQVIW